METRSATYQPKRTTCKYYERSRKHQIEFSGISGNSSVDINMEVMKRKLQQRIDSKYEAACSGLETGSVWHSYIAKGLYSGVQLLQEQMLLAESCIVGCKLCKQLSN